MCWLHCAYWYFAVLRHVTGAAGGAEGAARLQRRAEALEASAKRSDERRASAEAEVAALRRRVADLEGVRRRRQQTPRCSCALPPPARA